MGTRFHRIVKENGFDSIVIFTDLGTKNVNQATEIIDSGTTSQLYFILINMLLLSCWIWALTLPDLCWSVSYLKSKIWNTSWSDSDHGMQIQTMLFTKIS